MRVWDDTECRYIKATYSHDLLEWEVWRRQTWTYLSKWISTFALPVLGWFLFLLLADLHQFTFQAWQEAHKWNSDEWLKNYWNFFLATHVPNFSLGRRWCDWTRFFKIGMFTVKIEFVWEVFIQNIKNETTCHRFFCSIYYVTIGRKILRIKYETTPSVKFPNSRATKLRIY